MYLKNPLQNQQTLCKTAHFKVAYLKALLYLSWKKNQNTSHTSLTLSGSEMDYANRIAFVSKWLSDWPL